MSEDERLEMIAVLVKDASEVDDVVSEIRQFGSEMTFLLSQTEDHITLLRNEASALASVLQMVSQITGEVKSHIATARGFHAAWLEDTKPNLLAGIEEWENQREFYERFDLAYNQLLIEISSRRRRHEKAKKKAEDAQKELDRLHADDERAREAFTLAQGDFLPLDIWPGLRDPPRQYEVKAVALEREDDNIDTGGDDFGEEGGGVGAGSIPVLGRNVVERALGRVKRGM